MANELKGMKIAFLATDGVEQVELTEPWKAVEKAGGTPELISIKQGQIQGVNHMDKGDKFKVDKHVSKARPDDYAGIVQPGGVANPDFLRMNEGAVKFFRSFFERGSRPASSATGRGCSWRRMWPEAGPSPAGRASRPTSATPAARGSTRSASSTTDW